MAGNRRWSFSLLTVFLLTLIAALSVSQVVMMGQLHQARQEIDAVRKEFGYLQKADVDRIQIAKIEDEDQSRHRYRMRIPPGHRYLLHITDMEGFPSAGFPSDPKPTKSMSMNSWRNGADVILEWKLAADPDGTSRLVVNADSEELFNYRIENWNPPAVYPNSGWRLSTDEKRSFSPDELIRFFTRSNDELGRGVMLWMEPLREEH